MSALKSIYEYMFGLWNRIPFYTYRKFIHDLGSINEKSINILPNTSEIFH